MKFLYVIPARGGSKGIPHKNIKLLGAKPLIYYSLDIAESLSENPGDICVTTDDAEIIACVEKKGLAVPFVRPEYLATDQCGTYEVLLHALDFYEQQGYHYDAIVLLQPTSPFRTKREVQEAMELFDPTLDMVVSVKESDDNPYYNLFEEKESGFLAISKGNGGITRRQDAPKVWAYNGAIYVINTLSLKKMPLSKFPKIKKYVMPKEHSVDLDTPFDWLVAELIIQNNKQE